MWGYGLADGLDVPLKVLDLLVEDDIFSVNVNVQ